VAAGLTANPLQSRPRQRRHRAGGAVDQPTTSTCGLPGGAATVVIPIRRSILNVRDKPAGNILTTIPRGAQVNVVGGCGVKAAAGLAAAAGWRAACVLAGMTLAWGGRLRVGAAPVMSGAAAPPVVAAGLVANSQTAPAPQPPPVKRRHQSPRAGARPRA
jgi:hypothetical protein